MAAKTVASGSMDQISPLLVRRTDWIESSGFIGVSPCRHSMPEKQPIQGSSNDKSSHLRLRESPADKMHCDLTRCVSTEYSRYSQCYPRLATRPPISSPATPVAIHQ